MRGPTTLSRYYKAAAPATDKEDWFDTGDVAHIDEYGHMQVGLGRLGGVGGGGRGLLPAVCSMRAGQDTPLSHARRKLHSQDCPSLALTAPHCPTLPLTCPHCHFHCPPLAAARLQITDRSKDVIKSGGEWISSIEIENAAVGHPQVAGALLPAPAGGGRASPQQQ